MENPQVYIRVMFVDQYIGWISVSSGRCFNSADVIVELTGTTTPATLWNIKTYMSFKSTSPNHSAAYMSS